MSDRLDTVDLRVLELCIEQPRAGVRAYARLLGLARGTVQSRIAKLERLGVITGWGPVVSAHGLGFTTMAYVRLQLSQGVLDEVTESLRLIPEVIEVDSIAGESDLLCRVVSAGPENLEEVVQRILGVKGVHRSTTETVLRRRVTSRMRPLVEGLLREA